MLQLQVPHVSALRRSLRPHWAPTRASALVARAAAFLAAFRASIFIMILLCAGHLFLQSDAQGSARRSLSLLARRSFALRLLARSPPPPLSPPPSPSPPPFPDAAFRWCRHVGWPLGSHPRRTPSAQVPKCALALAIAVAVAITVAIAIAGARAQTREARARSLSLSVRLSSKCA